MRPLLIRNATLLLPGARQSSGALRAEGDTITWIGPTEAAPADPTAVVFDAGGQLLSPGLIDLQLNGAFGRDFTAEPAAVWPVAAQLPRFGVTAFLPTIITAPPGAMEAAQAALAQPPDKDTIRAQPLGLHLEGPFLNPARRGAHPPEHLRAPDPTPAAAWSPATGVRLVTLAPELPGALPLIETLAARGVVVSLGHTDAAYAQAQAGLAAGARYGTHLFNAMAPFSHREPGVIGALLEAAPVAVGLIADGVHVHPSAVRLAWRAKGPDHLCLVSDAMAGLGLGAGRYQLGGREVLVDGNAARLADGTLAGSLLSLDEAVRRLQRFTGCDFADAVAAASAVPAAVLGLPERYGRLAEGARADLVLWTAERQVAATWVGGRLACQRAPRQTAP
ncbi:MAG: N-acetylglucosamine-6-phosphate deacetylase [Anaerolineales bacterium]|nr:N-acetylglucosamine-6-phosphate deacetylase [Anaerolineales bacterium]